MAQLDLDTLLQQMVGAGKGSLQGNWPAISGLATASLKSLAQNLVDIETMKVEGRISEAQARLMIDMQKNAVRTVLLSEQGLGLLAAQAAINTALDVVKTTVDTALGWAIL